MGENPCGLTRHRAVVVDRSNPGGGDAMLRDRYGYGWMIASWFALAALILAVTVVATMLLGGVGSLWP